MTKINVLVVGAYSREHALAWKLRQSPRVGKVYIAPGNGGTGNVAENVPIGQMEFDALATFAEEKKIGLTVAGSDDPIVAGIVDVFQKRGLRIFGPSKTAAQIEGSKAFSKTLMREAGIPTAEFEVFTEHAEARRYVHERGVPIVIKASGLALGKGVYVCETQGEAEEALDDIMLKKIFKDSGNEVVVEEYLDGQEISIHALSDGTDFLMFPTSQDHKPVGENDSGKNTGGMGVISPVPWAEKLLPEVGQRVVAPTIAALRSRGAPFAGLLYPGLKIASKGMRVLEFNARFGCPEAEVYMRRMKTDILDLFEACVDGEIGNQVIEWHPGAAVTVMLVSGGYPDEYKKGLPITGIEEAEKVPDVVVFHAGSSRDKGQLVTSGGRVLSVSAVGNTLKEALARSYEAIERIHFENKYCRRDIGAKALVS